MFDWVNDDAPTDVKSRLAQIMDVFSTTDQLHPASVSIPTWAHEVSVSPCRGFDQEARRMCAGAFPLWLARS